MSALKEIRLRPEPVPVELIEELARSSGAQHGPAERLSALRASVSGPILFTTSFGLEDQFLAHLIFTHSLSIDVVTLDTGRLFPATYRLWAATEARYRVRIRSLHPDQEKLGRLVAEDGINGFYRSPEARAACCHVRKVEPLGRALQGAAAWVTGIRSDQSGARRAVELAAWDEAHGLVKFSPLFDWSREQVADRVAAEQVPVNELHSQGYLSIGCEPCTRAVAPGEPERAGRWWWESDEKKECGLHLVDGRLVRRGAGQ